MLMNEISEYLMSGKLDRPDPELDVYRHLRVGLAPAPTLEEVNALLAERYAEDNLPDLNSPEAIAAAEKYADIGCLPGPIEGKLATSTAFIVDEAQNIPRATVEELVEALKPIPPSKPSDFVAVVSPVLPKELDIVMAAPAKRVKKEFDWQSWSKSK